MIIDFHSHILPAADHGSDGIQTTAAQLQMMHEAGTEAVVMTPHFYPNRTTLDAFLAMRRASAVQLAALQRPETPQLYLGAEVLVCVGLQEMEGLEKLAIVGTNVILLEMPFRHWNNEIVETVLDIRQRGLCPILAHIDRYEKDDVHRLLRAGFLAQVNADGVAGLVPYLRNRHYFSSNSVVALGSDLHGAERGGYKHFQRAVARLGETADAVFAQSAELLKGALPLEKTIEAPEPVTV